MFKCLLIVLGLTLVFNAPAQSQTAAQAPLPIAPVPSPAQRQLAVQWLALLQAGKIDRSQLTDSLNSKMTDQVAAQLATTLRPYGTPASITYLGGRIVNGDDVYAYLFNFKATKLQEIMAFDKTGKIDGLVFTVAH